MLVGRRPIQIPGWWLVAPSRHHPPVWLKIKNHLEYTNQSSLRGYLLVKLQLWIFKKGHIRTNMANNQQLDIPRPAFFRDSGHQPIHTDSTMPIAQGCEHQMNHLSCARVIRSFVNQLWTVDKLLLTVKFAVGQYHWYLLLWRNLAKQLRLGSYTRWKLA